MTGGNMGVVVSGLPIRPWASGAVDCRKCPGVHCVSHSWSNAFGFASLPFPTKRTESYQWGWKAVFRSRMIRVIYKCRTVPFSFQSHRLCANTWVRAICGVLLGCVFDLEGKVETFLCSHIPRASGFSVLKGPWILCPITVAGSQTPFWTPALSPDLASIPFIPAKLLSSILTQRTCFLIYLCSLRTRTIF